jgi:hypothetical protein
VNTKAVFKKALFMARAPKHRIDLRRERLYPVDDLNGEHVDRRVMPPRSDS